ncbi:hypothetical protein, partial [Lacrimispora amygdalina]|uniref:hypothetical protein n=1 Tax=Lacrimispora amygdalina TaxID=253257 RepID=UPI00196A5115
IAFRASRFVIEFHILKSPSIFPLNVFLSTTFFALFKTLISLRKVVIASNLSPFTNWDSRFSFKPSIFRSIFETEIRQESKWNKVW